MIPYCLTLLLQWPTNLICSTSCPDNSRDSLKGRKPCRAFLAPAPVYLIDEGFMALSGRYFDLVTQYLNALAPEAVVVIAANERITALQARLEFPLRRWYMERGRLTILP
jgi:hypothetical protein